MEIKSLNHNEFVKFVNEWMTETKLTVDDVFQIKENESDSVLYMNVPDDLYQDFMTKYHDYDFEKTINDYVQNIIAEIIKHSETNPNP
jgi:hypothetical protein